MKIECGIVLLIVVFFIIYLTLIVFLLYYSIIYPNCYGNIFSSLNGLITSLSAISLGFLAIYQSYKHKHEIYEREITPILAIVHYKSTPLSDIDVIATPANNKSYSTKITLLICSLNKSVSNFIVKKLESKNDSEDSWHHTSENYKYNAVFLPEHFYKVQIYFPKAVEHNIIKLEFTFENICNNKYKQTMIFEAKNNEWCVQGRTSPCIPTE